MPRNALPCIRCGKELLNVFEELENQASDGLYFRSHGAYGSTVFDPMDGSFIEINVCDECLKNAGKSGRVLYGRDRKPVLTPDRVLIGWCDIPDRSLVPWDPDIDSREESLIIEDIDEWRRLEFYETSKRRRLFTNLEDHELERVLDYEEREGVRDSEGRSE